jgi:hypothetical protein
MPYGAETFRSSGGERRRLPVAPVASKIALASAGAAEQLEADADGLAAA